MKRWDIRVGRGEGEKVGVDDELEVLDELPKKKLELPTGGTGVQSVAILGANPKWTLSRFYNFLWGSIRSIYLLMIMHT